MRLLILGGTKFLSHEIARQAMERGHAVVCASRGISGPSPRDATFIQVDRDQIDGLESIKGDFDAVVDVARRPSHVRGATSALSGRAAHWTFVSSISVYADDRTPGQAAEEAALLPALGPDQDETDPTHYGSAKVSCENLVSGAIDSRALTVRAGLIVGPGDQSDRFTYWVDRIARGGRIVAPGSPDDLVQFVDVRDLAAWILDASEERLTGTYDAIASPIGRGAMMEAIASGLNCELNPVWVDQTTLIAAGVRPWMGVGSLPLWLPLPENAGAMSRDVSAAREAGLKIRSVAETARDTHQWQQSVGHVVSRTGLSPSDEDALLCPASPDD